MTFKDILLIIDDTPQLAARLEVALTLAAEHDAHLTGLYVAPPVTVPRSLETYLTDTMRAAIEADIEARIASACAHFTERADASGRLARTEWRVCRGDPTEIAVIHGRHADLVITGQLDPATSGPPTVEPEALLFGCGRPVLLVPYAGSFPTVGRRTLVGWNESREAARAVHDALPLLARARMVTLLAVNTVAEGSERPDEPSIDIASHLSRHGVRAEAAHVISDAHEIGDTLLNAATDLGCDLIVIGAYSQSRLRTLILGSLTGFLLRHMTVPVLMSH
jgi:nucleotide-binding universal stress UspA family protein